MSGVSKGRSEPLDFTNRTVPVKYRELGTTGLTVSEIGFGAWGIGGDSYGETDDEVSLHAVQTAMDRGITFYDTSNLYGDGRSERLVGQALKKHRGDVTIATKAGFTGSGDQDFRPGALRDSLEASLQRLQTDYVDLFMLHSPALDGSSYCDAFDLLQILETEGKVRVTGVSVARPEDAAVFIDDGIRAIQANFNLLDQRVIDADLLRIAATKGVGLIARTPLCFGFLTGQYSANDEFGEADHRSGWSIEQREVWADGIREFLSFADSQTPTAFALNFCLSFPEISTVIPGMLTSQHVEENSDASGLEPLEAGVRSQIYQVYRQREFLVKGARRCS